MIRPGVLAWIGAIVAAAVTLFLITYQVQHLDREIRTLKTAEVAETEAIRVLRAEWSFLNRPDRLAALAERHLQLSAVGTAQLTAAKTLEAPFEPKLTPPNTDRLQAMLHRVLGETKR
jgi:hypothetical protein